MDGCRRAGRGVSTVVPFTLALASGVVRGEARIPDDARGTVLCCHGFKGFARWGFFPLLAERLDERGFIAITYDGSGNGIGVDRESFTERDAFFANTYAREQADLDGVIAAAQGRGWLLDDGGFALVGHSRGGATALLHAARPDARVRALVTWAAIGDVRRWTAEQRRDWRARGWLDVPNTRTGEVLRLGTAQLDEIEVEGGASLDLIAAAGRLTIPWLIAHGADDETVSPDDGERLAAAAPHATHHVVPRAGHTFGATHPLDGVPAPLADVLGRTLDFLDRHAR